MHLSSGGDLRPSCQKNCLGWPDTFMTLFKKKKKKKKKKICTNTIGFWFDAWTWEGDKSWRFVVV